MARRRRIVIPGAAHHVVMRGNNRRTLFSYATDYRKLIGHVGKALEPETCRLHALTLMTNHVHCLVTPAGPDDLGQFVKAFAQRYALYRNRRRGGSGKLFQERYEVASRIRDDAELTPAQNSFIAPLQLLNDALKERMFTSLASTCLFDSRLLLDVNGRFHACERVNDQFSVGDVFSGLDFTKMETMVNQFAQINADYCSECSLRFLCERCFSTFALGDTLQINKTYCEKQRSEVPQNLDLLVKMKHWSLDSDGSALRHIAGGR